MNRRVRFLAVMLIGALLMTFGTGRVNAKAATSISINEDVYNLYADDVPAEIGDDVYSKFNSNVSNVDDYSMVFDSDAAYDSFTTALSKNRIEYNEDYICCFKASLYDWSGDDEKVITSLKVESYFPLPTDAQEYSDSCTFYKLSTGTLSQVYPLELYDIDDVLYVKLDFNSATDFNAVYGFVFSDPAEFEDEEEDDDDEEEEEDEDEDDPTSTPSPTPRPTAAPTQIPDNSSDDGDEPETKATSTPSPTPKQSSSQGSSGSSSGKKDNIPKTGDDFPLGGIVAAGIGSAAVLTGVIVILKKKK